MKDCKRKAPGLAGLLAVICVGALGVLLLDSGAVAENAGTAGLERAVVAKMLGQEAAQSFDISRAEELDRTEVNVIRMGDEERWIFGSAVIVAPRKEGAYPEGWLFVAEKSGDSWKVGLEGTETFGELTAKAPSAVVSAGEKETFSTSSEYRTAQAVRTKLRLPWARGVKWKMTGGPHGWSTGYDKPYAALDFASPKKWAGRVRAARGGRVYKMCSSNRGWLRVYHKNGWATDYYHLRKNIKPRDGRRIDTGAYLGRTGEDVSCGGAAYGRHVHFALLRYGKHRSLDKKRIGGWTFHVRKAYRGFAKHDGIKRYPGDRLYNYGN
jgi:LasA protease